MSNLCCINNLIWYYQVDFTFNLFYLHTDEDKPKFCKYFLMSAKMFIQTYLRVPTQYALGVIISITVFRIGFYLIANTFKNNKYQ